MTDTLESVPTAARPAPKAVRRGPSLLGRAGSLLRLLGTLVILFFVMFPILWLTLTAFKPDRAVFSTSILFRPSLDNFRAIIGGQNDLVGPMWNSVIVAVVTTVIAVPLSMLAAYGFSRYKFPGAKPILLGIVATQFIPGVAIALPFLTMYRDLGLLDTHLALIVTNLAIVVPYNTWLLKGFVDGLPVEIEEAGRLDGCGQLALLWRVVTPLAAPGIFVGVVFSFLLSWNEFLFPTFLARSNAVTLPVSLMTLDQPDGVLWGQMAAAGLLVMVPMIVLATLVRKHFAQGMTLGAVK
ncbi:carbohydrate ABC transporter permease [Nocardia grenadensis]|uniref:carbohydrate ABC transporter permease n=1 Tax=Nocardia grenadensis TaxID=931537 RepID=UPI0007A41A5E|nr:carbohydrate ABC transporter permease [Nocardia grenadensis]